MKIIKKTYSPTVVFFGFDTLVKMRDLIGSNKKILVISSSRGKKIFKKSIKKNLSFSNKIEYINTINSYPSVSIINLLFKKLFKKKYDFIIGYGGGSVLDTTKIIKSYLAIEKKINLRDLIIGIKNLKERHKIKLLLIPTTSGTGSEVTSFATVWDLKNKKKLSISSDKLYPNFSIVDPSTTADIDYKNRLFTGLDAINQLFDSYWSKSCNYESKILASKGIQIGMRSIIKLKENKFNFRSRLDIAKASLLSGFCISKTKTSVCHSISYPLTLFYSVPHGLACFFTTLAVFDYINSKKNNFFDPIFKNTKYKNINDLRSDLIKIYKKHNLISKMQSYVGNLKNLKNLTKFMLTNERSENFCLPITELTIKEILEKSYNKNY